MDVLLADDELADSPVFIASIWEVSPDDQWNLLGSQLLHGDLQWVGLTLSGHENGSVHAVSIERNMGSSNGQQTVLTDSANAGRRYCGMVQNGSRQRNLRDLERTGAKNSSTLVLGHIRGGDAFSIGLACHRGGWIATCRRVNNAVGSSAGAIVKLLLSKVIAIVDGLLILVEAIESARARQSNVSLVVVEAI